MAEKHTTIYVLMDNQAEDGFVCEWGLSYAIERDNELWLFDTGQSGRFLENAERLGIAPARAAGAAISHGHFDHTGGLAELAARGFEGPVFGHPDVLRSRYTLKRGDLPRECGVPGRVDAALEKRLRPVTTSLELADGLRFVSSIPRRYGLFEATTGFYFDAEGDNPDGVADDALLLLETPKGHVVLLGCCHSGLANTLYHLREEFCILRLHAVVGGLHLYDAEKTDMDEAVDVLREFQVEAVHPGHCTGKTALGKLKQRLKKKVRPLAAGQVLQF